MKNISKTFKARGYSIKDVYVSAGITEDIVWRQVFVS